MLECAVFFLMTIIVSCGRGRQDGVNWRKHLQVSPGYGASDIALGQTKDKGTKNLAY